MKKAEFPLIWDNTMRTTFASCPRQFWWEFIRKLGPSATSIHLHFGAAFAKGVEVVRRTYYDDKADLESALAHGLEALTLEYGDFEDNAELAKRYDSCVQALIAYFTEFSPGTDSIQPYMADGKASVEFTFALPIPEVQHPDSGEDLIYAGRFDMLGVYGGSLFVVDEKTTSQLGQSFYNKWDLRGQLTGYCWGARHYGLPVAGAVVRGIAVRKSGIEVANPVISYRPEWMVQQWYKQLVRDLKRAIRCYREGEWDWDFGNTCEAYGGCPFKRLCTTDVPERWIEGYFVERTWNPLAKDPLESNKEEAA